MDIPWRPRRKRRPKSERDHISDVRQKVFDRSGGRCEDRKSPKCLGAIRYESGYWNSMHLSHIRGRDLGGEWSVENCVAKCGECHIGWEHNGGKPCPKKPKANNVAG